MISAVFVDAVCSGSIPSAHENVDGSGYPLQLKGNEIHPFAKIIHVCDVYDALVSNRVYRKALNPSEALEYLMSNCWTMFDTPFVKKIMQSIPPTKQCTVQKAVAATVCAAYLSPRAFHKIPIPDFTYFVFKLVNLWLCRKKMILIFTKSKKNMKKSTEIGYRCIIRFLLALFYLLL